MRFMCKVKPGLRCSYEAKQQIIRLEDKLNTLYENMKANSNQEIENEIKVLQNKIDNAKFEYNLTPQGLEEAKSNSDAKEYAFLNKVATARSAAAKLSQSTSSLLKTLPENIKINGQQDQIDVLKEKIQQIKIDEQAMRDSLTNRLNSVGGFDTSAQILTQKVQQLSGLRKTSERYLQVVEKAKAECDRQHVGSDRVHFLMNAYEKAEVAAQTKRYPDVDDIQHYAGILEPDSKGTIRSTNVTFMSGGSAASGDAAYAATHRLFSLLDEEVDADEFVHSYLRVHPFEDGNGRSAWLLRTWIQDQWEKPETLPHYKF